MRFIHRIWPLIICACIILLMTHPLYAFEVRVMVDRNEISIQESVYLTVTITDTDGEVDVRSIKDFKVISQGSSSRTIINNMEMKRDIVYNYTLVPLKTGVLYIPRLRAIVGKQVKYSNPIKIKVSETKSNGKNSRDAFVEASLSNEYPYVGEQIIYSFKLYNTVQIANAQWEKPSFEGFSASPYKEIQPRRIIREGREFELREIKFILMPIKSGDLTIEPALASLDIIIRQKNSRNNFFFQSPFFSNSRKQALNLRTKSLDVRVSPLPDFHGHGQFSGLIGDFNIEASIENSNLKVGDSVTLSITISGKGNIMDAEEPIVKISDAFKTYKDEPEEKIDINENGFFGEKIFRIALVPVKPGEYQIDPIPLVFFNNTQGKYRQIQTKAFNVKMSPSDDANQLEVFNSQPETGLPKLKKKKVEFTGRDILPLKSELDAIEDQTHLNFLKFCMILLCPMIGIGILQSLLLLIRKQTDTAGLMMERGEKALKHAMTQIEKPLDCLANLYTALVSIIYGIAKKQGESLTGKEAETILLKNGFPLESAQKASVLLSKIESARFGGALPNRDVLIEMHNEIKQLLKKGK